MLDKISEFCNKYGAIINYVIKPLLSLVVALAIGGYVLWLDTHYVPVKKFAEYSEVTNKKLDIIMQNQLVFTEQYKMVNFQILEIKDANKLFDERLRYVERNKVK